MTSHLHFTYLKLTLFAVPFYKCRCTTNNGPWDFWKDMGPIKVIKGLSGCQDTNGVTNMLGYSDAELKGARWYFLLQSNKVKNTCLCCPKRTDNPVPAIFDTGEEI